MKALAWIVGAVLFVLGVIYVPRDCGCAPPDSTNAAARAFITGGAER